MKESLGTGRIFLVLHALLAFFSFSGVASKFAAQNDFMSFGFVACYGCMLAILGVYAIGWQQVIKRLPLTTAYANRAITIVWGLVWGVLLFGEDLNWQKILGACIVILGVALFAVADNGAETHE